MPSRDRCPLAPRCTHYVGPVQLLLGLIPTLVARRGHIINIPTGNAVVLPAPKWAAYGASKAAFDHWFHSSVRS